MNEKNKTSELRVINIGLRHFADALRAQDVSVAEINWRPARKQSAEIIASLKKLDGLEDKINQANTQAVKAIIDAQPYWEDVLPALECVDGMTDYMILHSGPNITYDKMSNLHRRGLVSGVLFEGWAQNEKDAIKLIESGKVKIDSALNHNTVGAGTGIITKSVAMMVIRDRNSGKIAATFPAEGPFQGGFCGWGLYSKEIAANLAHMRKNLLPVLAHAVKNMGGIPLKPILAESFQMGDENHTRQSAADLLLIKKLIPELLKLDIDKKSMIMACDYVVDTPRFFHCLGQGASRAAISAAENIPYSTMVTALGGNGLEYGIKVSGLGDKWFTAPAPMIKGRYTSSRFSEKDQLPWMGDSCVVECAGMGGLAAAASPIVSRLQGLTVKEGVAVTREMEEICITKNPAYSVPNLDFDFLPVGIDIRKVLQKGILPAVHGGMFGYDGGLIGAGSARVPADCFKNAFNTYLETYKEMI